MSTIRLCLLAIVICALTGCAALRPEPPEVQLAGLEVRELSLSHANFMAHLRLYNPNATAINIKGLDFTLYLNEIRVARGMTAKALHIPAEEFGETSLQLASSILDLLQLTTRLQNRERISYRIAGSVKVGGTRLFSTTVPIERKGELPLSGSLQQLIPGQNPLLRQ